MRAMSEDQLQACVTDAAERGGWLWWHDVDSRRNKSGLPDLILVHPRTGRLLFVELKSATGKPRPAQITWLQALTIRHETYLWRPADWFAGTINQILLGERTAPARKAS